jgi:hypothetical protein
VTELKVTHTVLNLDKLEKLLPSIGMAAYVVSEDKVYAYSGKGLLSGWEEYGLVSKDDRF